MNREPDFYDKVIINEGYRDPDIAGCHGVIIGISNNNIKTYAVYVTDVEECYTLSGYDFVLTGEKINKDQLYTGNSIIVDAYGKKIIK